MNQKLVSEVAEEIIGEKILKITKDDKGLHNYNFIITTKNRRLVAKISGSKSAVKSKALKKQDKFLNTHSKDLNVPESIAYSENNKLKHPIILIEFIDGVHIDFNDLSLQQIKKLAQEVARIHSVTAKKYSGDYAAPPLRSGTFHDYASTFTDVKVFKQFEKYACHIKLEEHLQIIQSGLDLLQDTLNDKRTFNRKVFSLLHTDIGMYNLIWKKNDPFFIDWDDKMYGDPASEIGYIFAINNSDSRFRKIFLSEYKKHVWDVHFLERIKFYELMNRLFDVMWSLSKFDENSDTLKTKKKKVYAGYYNERYSNLENYLRTNKSI